jgi:hypothetical protein
MNIDNIFDLINNSNYSVNDYNKIIDLCHKKIISKEMNEHQTVFKNNIKNIKINNEELICFFYSILNSISFTIEDTNDFESVCINFNYNDYLINLCLYYEDFQVNQKICINNNRTHKYEVFYEKHGDILLKILDLKTTTSSELNELIKKIFDCLPDIFINEW